MLRGPAFVVIFFIASHFATAQEWTFVKQKEGISLFTRKEAGKDLKAYKGTMDIRSTIDKVAALIRDVNDNDWWNDNLSEIRVISNNDPMHFQYYMVYDLGWPLSDRDLVIDSWVTSDPGHETIRDPLPVHPHCRPGKGGGCAHQGLLAIVDRPGAGKGIVRVTLEGFANPAGDIPDWILNAAILDSPFKILKGVRERVGQ